MDLVSRLERTYSGVVHDVMRAAQGRLGFERCPDLLEHGIEGGITRRRIALLDVDLDLDRVLIVGARKAAERLLGLARITVAQMISPRPGPSQATRGFARRRRR